MGGLERSEGNASLGSHKMNAKIEMRKSANPKTNLSVPKEKKIKMDPRSMAKLSGELSASFFFAEQFLSEDDLDLRKSVEDALPDTGVQTEAKQLLTLTKQLSITKL